MKYILPAIWICACLHTAPSGRKYRLVGYCAEGHFEKAVDGYTPIMLNWSNWVCDSIKVDTMWVK